MPDLKGVGIASLSVVLQHHIDPWEQGLGSVPTDLLCHRQRSSRNLPWAVEAHNWEKEESSSDGKAHGPL